MIKYVLLAICGFILANATYAEEGKDGIEQAKEIGSLKEWNELTKSLTKENIKTAVVKKMYYDFKGYRGDGQNTIFDRDVIQRFLQFHDNLLYSENALQIDDLGNERLYATIILQDGTEVYVRLATGSVSVADCAAMGFSKETLDKITWGKMTVNEARTGMPVARAMLAKLINTEKYKNLKDDDIAFYSLVTGYMTVNKKKTMYFVINQNVRDVLNSLLEEPLQNNQKK